MKCTKLLMTYYVKTPEMGVSILNHGVGKPLSVRPATDNVLLKRNNLEFYFSFEFFVNMLCFENFGFF